MYKAGHFRNSNKQAAAVSTLVHTSHLIVTANLCPSPKFRRSINHGKTKGLCIARNILAPLSIENTSRNLVEAKGIFSLWLLMPQTIEI